jgi:hypothetical protein
MYHSPTTVISAVKRYFKNIEEKLNQSLLFALLRTKSNLTYKEIAERFKVKKSLVIRSVKEVFKQVKTDLKLYEAYHTIDQAYLPA